MKLDLIRANARLSEIRKEKVACHHVQFQHEVSEKGMKQTTPE